MVDDVVVVEDDVEIDDCTTEETEMEAVVVPVVVELSEPLDVDILKVDERDGVEVRDELDVDESEVVARLEDRSVVILLDVEELPKLVVVVSVDVLLVRLVVIPWPTPSVKELSGVSEMREIEVVVGAKASLHVCGITTVGTNISLLMAAVAVRLEVGRGYA